MRRFEISVDGFPTQQLECSGRSWFFDVTLQNAAGGATTEFRVDTLS